jgi:hypothetical protein
MDHRSLAYASLNPICVAGFVSNDAMSFSNRSDYWFD